MCVQEIKSEGLHNEVCQILNGYKQVNKGVLLLIAVTFCDSEIRKLMVETGFGVAAWKRWVGAVHGHPRTSSCAEISSIRSMMAIEMLSSCDLFTAYQQCDGDRGAERPM